MAEVGLEAALAALQAENAVRPAEITAHLGRLAELERRLGLNSGNNGKPPSSDGQALLVRVGGLRAASGKQPGWQEGHPGETLRRTAMPDATIDHDPPICTACGEPLTAAMATGHVVRQVFDLSEP